MIPTGQAATQREIKHLDRKMSRPHQTGGAVVEFIHTEYLWILNKINIYIYNIRVYIYKYIYMSILIYYNIFSKYIVAQKIHRKTKETRTHTHAHVYLYIYTHIHQPVVVCLLQGKHGPWHNDSWTCFLFHQLSCRCTKLALAYVIGKVKCSQFRIVQCSAFENLVLLV